jgi:hypothetical protein
MAEVNQQLRDLELLEIEVLDLLNSENILNRLYFGGGTMLRLCHNLTRYSTGLDFWLRDSVDSEMIHNKLESVLKDNYTLIDSMNKFHTLLFQIKSPNSKRSLKIEIRKEQSDFEWERKIAFSKFTNKQIQVNGLTLNQMMKNKISALLSRKIIRDCFDIDFLYKRGIQLPKEKELLKELLSIIHTFKERDFKVTLGSLLEADQREYLTLNKFQLLENEIEATLKLI